MLWQSIRSHHVEDILWQHFWFDKHSTASDWLRLLVWSLHLKIFSAFLSIQFTKWKISKLDVVRQEDSHNFTKRKIFKQDRCECRDSRLCPVLGWETFVCCQLEPLQGHFLQPLLSLCLERRGGAHNQQVLHDSSVSTSPCGSCCGLPVRHHHQPPWWRTLQSLHHVRSLCCLGFLSQLLLRHQEHLVAV